VSAMQRRKGARVERELVELHKALGIHAERVPLSGAMRYKGNGADLDCYIFGPEAAPLIGEVKARKAGAGFATIARWLGPDNDLLFLKSNNAEPMVVLPWRTWARLLARVQR
jgi:hypothetical protein